MSCYDLSLPGADEAIWYVSCACASVRCLEIMKIATIIKHFDAKNEHRHYLRQIKDSISFTLCACARVCVCLNSINSLTQTHRRSHAYTPKILFSIAWQWFWGCLLRVIENTHCITIIKIFYSNWIRCICWCDRNDTIAVFQLLRQIFRNATIWLTLVSIPFAVSVRLTVGILSLLAPFLQFAFFKNNHNILLLLCYFVSIILW